MRGLLLTLFLALITTIQAQSPFNKTVYNKADKAPEFPGGDAALTKLFLDSIEMPSVKWEEAADSDLRTKIVLSFLVDVSGKVSDVKVVQSMNARMDKKFVALAQKLKFKPAIYQGKPVNFRYILPLTIEPDER